MNEKGLSHIAYFRTDGGSCRLYTEEYVNSLKELLDKIYDMFKDGYFEDGCDCIHIFDMLEEWKKNDTRD